VQFRTNMLIDLKLKKVIVLKRKRPVRYYPDRSNSTCK
jgi:hypothetical protein